MRGNEFLDKLELIDPALIEAADEAPKRTRAAWVKWSGLAACLCVVAVSVFALTAPRKEPPEPAQNHVNEPPELAPDPVDEPLVPAPDPVDVESPQKRTSDTYENLEELLDYLKNHDSHSRSDAQGNKGGYSAAHAATEGTDTVSCQGIVYQINDGARLGVYQNGVLTGTVDAPADWLFVSGNRLVTVWMDSDAGELNPEYRVRVSIFDLANPAYPQKLDTFSQLGNLTACWMAGTQLYLMTDDGVCACGYSRLSNLEDYKPQLFHGDDQLPWPDEGISILGTPSRVSYVAVTRIDTENQSVVSRHAFYGDIEEVFYGQDWLTLVTQTSGESAIILQDVYTFNGTLSFTGKVDLAGVFGLEKTLAWSEDEQPPREYQIPEVKAVDYTDGVWRMVGQINHNIGPSWRGELFALTYDMEESKTEQKTISLPEDHFNIDDVVWETDRAIISTGYVQLDPYETGTRLAFAQFDGMDIVLLSSDLTCDRVRGIDMIYEYGNPLGKIQPFIALGDGRYLRYNGTPDGFDLYDLSDSESPVCLYRSQGAIPDLPEGGRLDFDSWVLDENTVAVKLITPGPDGNYFRDATRCWIILDVRPSEEIPVTLRESPKYSVTGVDPSTLG